MADRARSLELYRGHAPTYERAWALEILRRPAVAALALEPGHVVIDAGCGTGLSFDALQQAIGPRGRIIGIDQSPQMLARARALVAARGWRNVTLLESPVEDADIPERADALLFVLVHDVLRSDAALANVLGALRPGGRVGASGRKLPRWYPWPARAMYVRRRRRYQTSAEGLHRLWDKLARLVPDLRARTLLPGWNFVAWGRWPHE
jgi:SAM-dependent methyltransferase